MTVGAGRRLLVHLSAAVDALFAHDAETRGVPRWHRWSGPGVGIGIGLFVSAVLVPLLVAGFVYAVAGMV